MKKFTIEANYLTSTFQGFCLPFGNSYFPEQLLCAGQVHIYIMRDFQSKSICSQFNYTFAVLERSLLENSCSEAFEITGEVVNNALT